MALTEVPIELSSTPGIVDNSTGTAITIDASSNVDVAGTVTADGLTVETAAGTSGTIGLLRNSSSAAAGNAAYLDFKFDNTFSGNNVDVQVGAIKTNAGNEESAFVVKTTEGTGTPLERFRAAANGDISFYENTGTTAKLFWDASAENLTITGQGDQLLLARSSVDTIQFGTGTVSPITGLFIQNATDSNIMMKIDDSAPTDSFVLNSSGNVGIGVTPSASHYKSLEIGAAGSGITGRGAADTYFLSGLFWDGAATYEYSVSSVPVGTYQITNGIHSWATAPAGTAGTAATPQTNMTLDASGNLLVGTTDATTTGDNGWVFFPDGGGYSRRNGTASVPHFRFYNNADVSTTEIGSITSSGSSTAYNETSDQRLKENIVDAPSASDDIDAIQVRSFDWKADGSHRKYGMIAQELAAVAPQAVHQPEDPEEMMGVDYSKLVPMMLKEIQSLRARVAQLEGAN